MPKALPLLQDLSPICCPPIGDNQALSADDALALALRLKALADSVRLQLLVHMLHQPGNEACTCELAPLVGLSEPTVSHHLKKLEGAGLVVKERRGMSVYYRVVPEAIHAIAKTLHLKCC
ncbi:MAG TPA: metalloregulator ArsR/SmtB family transcription factor [Candidatus Nanopelagicaceae bacterium]|nr:metalloregulator ArsR/SmtB family transcription factor [Candidatus Nanopelagicaceae bacterium]